MEAIARLLEIALWSVPLTQLPSFFFFLLFLKHSNPYFLLPFVVYLVSCKTNGVQEMGSHVIHSSFFQCCFQQTPSNTSLIVVGQIELQLLMLGIRGKDVLTGD